MAFTEEIIEKMRSKARKVGSPGELHVAFPGLLSTAQVRALLEHGSDKRISHKVFGDRLNMIEPSDPSKLRKLTMLHGKRSQVEQEE